MFGTAPELGGLLPVIKLAPVEERVASKRVPISRLSSPPFERPVSRHQFLVFKRDFVLSYIGRILGSRQSSLSLYLLATCGSA